MQAILSRLNTLRIDTKVNFANVKKQFSRYHIMWTPPCSNLNGKHEGTTTQLVYIVEQGLRGRATSSLGRNGEDCLLPQRLLDRDTNNSLFSFSFMFLYWMLNCFVALLMFLAISESTTTSTASLVSQQSSEDRHVSFFSKQTLTRRTCVGKTNNWILEYTTPVVYQKVLNSGCLKT